MPNYANGKIYTIRSHQTDKFYIGSTTQKLSKRLVGHRTKFKCWKNGTIKYKTSSFEILQYDDYYIELLEEFPCANKMELDRREGFYIRENRDICVNCFVAGRTIKEYYEDNKDKIKKREAQYRNDNKEKISKRMTLYYQNNKEKLVQYSKNNREQIHLRHKQKITCECGSIIRIYGKPRHDKTNKHKQWVENNETTEVSTEDFNNLHTYI